jgi:hypothetical protein
MRTSSQSSLTASFYPRSLQENCINNLLRKSVVDIRSNKEIFEASLASERNGTGESLYPIGFDRQLGK